MRNLRILAALSVAMLAMATNANAGLLKNRGCGCDAPPKCAAPEPTCCAPVTKCNPFHKFGGRMKGMFNRGCGCDAKEATCGMEVKDCGMDMKDCGWEASCCAPVKSCRPRMKINFKGMFRRRGGCGDKGCEPVCGAEPKCEIVEDKCGCDAAPKCKGPSLMDRLRAMCPKRSAKGCGMEIACGCGK